MRYRRAIITNQREAQRQANLGHRDGDDHAPAQVIRRISWRIMIIVFLITCFGIAFHQLRESKRISNQPNTQISDGTPLEKEDSNYQLIQSIERTVRAYYSAKTIEEKIRFVRFAEQMRPHMEIHYSRDPLKAEACERITNFKPMMLGSRPCWKVLVLKQGREAEIIMLEQISDTEVLVDWDSQVDYQEVPWAEYCSKCSDQEVCYRLAVEESNRYIAEFINESQWACYALSKPGQEGALYGYVKRNSQEHQAIQQAPAQQSVRMILKIQGAREIKAKESVVIHKVVSDCPYLVDPPRSRHP